MVLPALRKMMPERPALESRPLPHRKAANCKVATAPRPFASPHGTAGPAFPQHVVAHVPLVGADDREMIFTASGEEIHRMPDFGWNFGRPSPTHLPPPLARH